MNKNKCQLLLFLLAVICVLSFFGGTRVKAAVGTVTSYEKITWGISTGRYGVNGIHAFCAEYNKTFPTVGTTIDSIEECENEILRKALYYGYNGPANALGTDARAHVLTAIAISDANIGERATGASAKYDEFYWDIVNNPEAYPSPPNNFKAYLAITSSDSMQNLAFYGIQKNGFVKAVKTSSDSTIKCENPCYSLEGAQYGLYSSSLLSEDSRVGTLITDANGQSNTVELSAGTYYACEESPPKGYAMSTEVTTFTVSPEETTVLTFTDEPQVNPVEILLQKVDAETKTSTPYKRASLKGAQFTVKYYAGLWEDGVDPQTVGAIPERSWVFETDESGLVYFKESYLVSGDELYPAIPLGTVTIQETKSSEGYLLNNEIVVRQITSDGISRYVSTYNAPVIEEDLLQVEVIKYQTGTERPIAGTVFEHTAPDGESELLTTDETGKIVIKGLNYGTHTLREVSAAGGYVLNQEVYEFVIDETINEHLTIILYNDPILPKTGSSTTFLMSFAGIALCIVGRYPKTQKTEKRRENL